MFILYEIYLSIGNRSGGEMHFENLLQSVNAQMLR